MEEINGMGTPSMNYLEIVRAAADELKSVETKLRDRVMEVRVEKYKLSNPQTTTPGNGMVSSNASLASSNTRSPINKGTIPRVSKKNYMNAAKGDLSHIEEVMNPNNPLFKTVQVKTTEINTLKEEIKMIDELLYDKERLEEELGVLSKGLDELRVMFSRRIIYLSRMIINIKYRNYPTSFVLLDKNMIDSQYKGDKIDNSSVIMQHFTQLYSLLNQSEVTNIEKEMEPIIQNHNYSITLLCEVCGKMMHDATHPPYSVNKPKQIVSKILPLALAGVHYTATSNSGKRIGRVFGYPTAQQGMDAVRVLLTTVNERSVSRFASLQNRFLQGNNSYYSTGNDMNHNIPYCVKEFNHFLHNPISGVDREMKWFGLCEKYDETTGMIYYACPDCFRVL
eukprot:gene11424-15309_t